MRQIDIMEIGGFKIGHAQDLEAGTGCSVFLFDEITPVGIDLRGGGCATRETHLLHPLSAAQGIHAILLAGGSAFGLDASGGVMEFLEEREIGVKVGDIAVPLVCQSGLFDLAVGCSYIRPDKAMGYKACENATDTTFSGGNVGAGTGCTVGKVLGMEFATKTGIGSYAVQVGDIKIGAVVALNALGDIYDGRQQIAGMLNEDKNGLRSCQNELLNITELLSSQNTTLAVIATNTTFSKAELCKISGVAQNGFAKAISPVHTSADGDTIYTASCGYVKADLSIVASLAAHVTEKAIINAVYTAEPAYGFISKNTL
ncbi:peptidase [Candidatus Epulonipiscium fishelsonii]|nr:peptidase [Epulopiscium sp. SCG-C06WGA-EpuloA1]